MNILRKGATLYELNNEKIQMELWSAHVDRGFKDDGTRMSSEECVEIARKLQEAPLLAKELVEALDGVLLAYECTKFGFSSNQLPKHVEYYEDLIKRAKAND